jgi:hypothetical protein
VRLTHLRYRTMYLPCFGCSGSSRVCSCSAALLSRVLHIRKFVLLSPHTQRPSTNCPWASKQILQASAKPQIHVCIRLLYSYLRPAALRCPTLRRPRSQRAIADNRFADAVLASNAHYTERRLKTCRANNSGTKSICGSRAEWQTRGMMGLCDGWSRTGTTA